MARCQICATENVESAEACQRCNAPLNDSPTMSISSQPGDGAARQIAAGQSRGFAPGDTIGERYRVVSLLGRGGMGEVYSADDLKLGQRVALKFLATDRLKSSSWRDHFYAEVRIARQISHPNVCRVYDLEENDGQLFLSMEFVDGEDLASLLRRIGRLPDDKAVEVAQQLCAGLSAAHNNGVLHRDLKPSNVMLDGKGRARLTDFGLAIPASEAGQTNQAGTPGYMAPELLNGARPSVRSDIYALGLLLYEIFTGKRAFEASDLVSLYRKQSETNAIPPSDVVRNLDPAVERAILRCLERDPAKRPQSALSVAAALPGGDPLAAALAAGETPSPEMVAAAVSEGSLKRSTAWLYLISSLSLLLIAFVLFLPRETDWGLARMEKSPEVLADRAQELATKLGYPSALDRAFWLDTDRSYIDYVASHPSQAAQLKALGSPVTFFYRQSPRWMTPDTVWVTPYDMFPSLRVSESDPPSESTGMLSLKFNSQGKLRMLHAIPSPSAETSHRRSPDWALLFAEAGLDGPLPPTLLTQRQESDNSETRMEWQGHLDGLPDLKFHVLAEAHNGVPVSFEVRAPWDTSSHSEETASNVNVNVVSAIALLVIVGYGAISLAVARKNMRSGRGDEKGALKVAGFAALLLSVLTISNYHFVPRPDYIIVQFVFLGVAFFYAILAWLNYMAIEPYVRRTWPSLLVSWQRLLTGRFLDPLVGRDILLGCLGGCSIAAISSAISAAKGYSEAASVVPSFGRDLFACIGFVASLPAQACVAALIFVSLLSLMNGLLRKRWLAMIGTGLIAGILVGGQGGSATDYGMALIWAVLYLSVVAKAGLVGAASFHLLAFTDNDSPPLELARWYAGRSALALLVPFAVMLWGFYASLGGQTIFGGAQPEE